MASPIVSNINVSKPNWRWAQAEPLWYHQPEGSFCHTFLMVAPQPSNLLVDSDTHMCSVLDSGIQTCFPGTPLLCSAGR